MGFDGRGDGTVHVGDAAGGIAVQPTDDHDAGVVRLIAVVEDEIVAGCVVPDIADVGSAPSGWPSRDSGEGSGPVFSTDP